MKNTFLCKGHVVTASSKSKALRVVAAINKGVEDYLVKLLRGFVSEENVRKYSKEIENIFDSHFFWRNGAYELTIYRDRDDNIGEVLRRKKITTFDEYYDLIYDIYQEYELDEFFETAESIQSLLEEEGIELEDDVDELRLRLQEEIGTNYPDFLSDEVEVDIGIKNVPEMKKLIYGSSSNINIATKCVKHKLGTIIEQALLECVERYEGEIRELNDSEKIKAITNFLDYEDKHKDDELLYLIYVNITVRDYLSINDNSDHNSVKAVNIETTGNTKALLSYGYGPDDVYNDGIDLTLGKLNIEYIEEVRLK